MKDILGRDIPVGGLVVVKPTGRHSSGLHYGVVKEDCQIIRPNYGKTLTVDEKTVFTVTSYYEYVWIDSPSELLEKLRVDILDFYGKYLVRAAEERKAKAKTRRKTGMSKFEQLHIYGHKGSRFEDELYIGDCEINGKAFKNVWLTLNTYNGQLKLCRGGRTYGVDFRECKKPFKDEDKRTLTREEFKELVKKYNDTKYAVNWGSHQTKIIF